MTVGLAAVRTPAPPLRPPLAYPPEPARCDRFERQLDRCTTHMETLSEPEASVKRSERLSPHIGPIPVQLPPGWRALAAAPRDLCEHGSCSPRKLTAVARWIEARRERGSDVWVFLDHDPEGAAVQDARALPAHARRRAREEV